MSGVIANYTEFTDPSFISKTTNGIALVDFNLFDYPTCEGIYRIMICEERVLWKH